MTELVAPTQKQITNLTGKIKDWLDEFYASKIFDELNEYNHLSRQQYADIVLDFALGMLSEEGRQPSRWTNTSATELLEKRGADWASEVTTADREVTFDTILDVVSDFLDFCGEAGKLRNGGKLADSVAELMEEAATAENLATIAEHLGDTFIRVSQFFKMSNMAAVQSPTFLNAHLVDVLLLADSASFMDMAMIAALGDTSGEQQDDFVEAWLAKYAMPEINVQVAGDHFASALGIKNNDAVSYQFVMAQLHNEMTPVAPATRLSVAMRLEGMELKDGDITEEITFLQKHRAVLNAVPAMLEYLPKEQLNQRQKSNSSRKNNVLSFAAAKKLAQKRNKRK
ncbi:hypothetical protein [Lacticaseibacillus hulanensis]|uniref:hypothetical protein n=1 Tax=Lacticaseibacillus hulanensis TaxID=2493111 RepID=UPI000FDA90A4|nr:hypothetical protein [Lacticaseibacillus hulanensis]